MYEWPFKFWILVYLATKGFFSYERVYDCHPDPTQYWVHLSHLATRLPRYKCIIVRRKLEQFLRSGSHIWCGRTVLRIPSTATDTLLLVRHAVDYVIKVYRSLHTREEADFIRRRIKVISTKCQKTAGLLCNYRGSAALFDADGIFDVDEAMHTDIKSRADVKWISTNFDIALYHNYRQSADSAWPVFRSLLYSLNMDCYSQVFGRYFEYIGGLHNDVDDEVFNMVNNYKATYPDSTFVPIDKDIKRLTVMPTIAYQYRLGLCFIADPIHYKIDGKFCTKSMVRDRKRLAKEYLPKSLLSYDLDKLATFPRANHLYKSKCMVRPGGLDSPCIKPHMHVREIIADPSHSFHSYLSLCARSLRLAKLLSRDRAWTLWSQRDLATNLKSKVDNLVVVDEYKWLRMNCKQPKKRVLTMIKIDAAQFFKEANPQRGMSRTRILFSRIEKSTGFNAVRVRRDKKACGSLCKAGDKKTPGTSIVTFEEILQAFTFVLKEDSFLLGNYRIRRLTGYPMGGSFSEPATLIDLQDDVRQLYTKKQTAVRCGWWHSQYCTSKIVNGLQHVDDALLMSACICDNCLEQGLKKLWPSDVGVSTEEKGDEIRFLQGHI